MSRPDDPEFPVTDNECGFLGRWSRRKSEARSGDASADGLSADAEAGEGGDLSAVEPEIDPEELEALEAIDIEAMDYSADFSAFMKRGVPEVLKKRALRQLWRTSPVLANIDGLNDYDDDFRVKHTILEKFQSAYKIGKGHLTDEEWAKSRGETVEPEDDADSENVETAETADTVGEADEPESETRAADHTSDFDGLDDDDTGMV